MPRIPNVTPDEIFAAAQDQMFDLGNTGFCTSCGAEHYSVEPDARNYPCEECDEPKVFGATELMMMGYAQ